jgi:hypothetical protein
MQRVYPPHHPSLTLPIEGREPEEFAKLDY